jgi:hypothetical protein
MFDTKYFPTCSSRSTFSVQHAFSHNEHSASETAKIDELFWVPCCRLAKVSCGMLEVKRVLWSMCFPRLPRHATFRLTHFSSQDRCGESFLGDDRSFQRRGRGGKTSYGGPGYVYGSVLLLCEELERTELREEGTVCTGRVRAFSS